MLGVLSPSLFLFPSVWFSLLSILSFLLFFLSLVGVGCRASVRELRAVQPTRLMGVEHRKEHAKILHESGKQAVDSYFLSLSLSFFFLFLFSFSSSLSVGSSLLLLLLRSVLQLFLSLGCSLYPRLVPSFSSSVGIGLKALRIHL